MKILPVDHHSAIEQVAAVIKKGGLVAFPTDTVYGLAANAFNPDAIEKLFLVKGRDFNKAIAILIGENNQLKQIASEFSGMAKKLSKRFWPGALTLVVPIQQTLPKLLSPTETIGIRMPDHNFVLRILKTTGPLATTSANLSGGKNPLTAEDVVEQLGNNVDLIIDGGLCPGGIPSTVVDCTQQEIRIIREGGLSRKIIFDYLFPRGKD